MKTFMWLATYFPSFLSSLLIEYVCIISLSLESAKNFE